MRNFSRLTSRPMQISLPADERGLVGRLCPIEACAGYFKVKPGTGVQGVDRCVCAYCGHASTTAAFLTPVQRKYVESCALNLASAALLDDLKGMLDNRSYGGGFIKITTSVSGSPSPIRRYREKELETHATCSGCTLEYAVYGAFAFCPDCGEHNSLAILEKNFAVIETMLVLAEAAEGELAQRLVENGLEDIVSAFDGFGRELCRRAAPRSSAPAQAGSLSFQNLAKADAKVMAFFKVAMAGSVPPDAWNQAHVAFQKRHLLAHAMGIVDDAYLAVTRDRSVPKGRKVRITAEEVRQVMGVLRAIATVLRSSLG